MQPGTGSRLPGSWAQSRRRLQLRRVQALARWWLAQMAPPRGRWQLAEQRTQRRVRVRVQVQMQLSAPGWRAGCWRCWRGGRASAGLRGQEEERQSQHTKQHKLM